LIHSRLSTVILLIGACASLTHAATILSESFDNITTLASAGWVQTNKSSPLGTTNWFQGNTAVFEAEGGPINSYIAANFNNAGFEGNISNWLLTPMLTFNNLDVLSFFTRTETPVDFPDRLEVRLSSSGASTNVGDTDSSVGDFTSLLLSINPTLAPSGYPETWTNYLVTLSGLVGPTSGRLAFRYFVTDPSINGNYIGIDTVSVSSDTAPAIPEPSTVILSLIGLGSLMAIRGISKGKS